MAANSHTETRHCPECGEKIIGRIDKIFCSDQCRNTYNNKLNSYANNTVRNINNTLRKNRRIIEELNGLSDKSMVTKDALLSKGFNFNYHTHTYTTKRGDIYRYCYEQGYLFLEDKNLYLLITHKEKNDED